MPSKKSTPDLFDLDPVSNVIHGLRIKAMSPAEADQLARFLSETGGRSFEDSKEIIRLYQEGKESEAAILLEESTNLTGEQRKRNYDTGTNANEDGIARGWEEVKSPQEITSEFEKLSLSPSAGEEGKNKKKEKKFLEGIQPGFLNKNKSKSKRKGI